ncbi:MAG TPA: YjbH domain-containing protein [Ignavibacteriales bacterium]|nr:YjbH domain-containing protein [Ignavibacteriales bacterium]
MKLKAVLTLFVLLLPQLAVFPQGQAGSGAESESEYLIDMPTAGVLEKGRVGVNFYLMPQGVVISRLEVAPFENFSFGISYGAANFIGSGNPQWYKLPGVAVKAKIVEESEGLPAVALGFDSQGKGEFIKNMNDAEIDRFRIKSPGFYASASKNFQFWGYLSLHGTLNYSLERQDGDKDLNFSMGLEKTIGSRLSVIAEYDFGINDNTANSLGDGNGYLNCGLRWSLSGNFTVGFDLRDLLNNKKLNAGTADRALNVQFVNPIF